MFAISSVFGSIFDEKRNKLNEIQKKFRSNCKRTPRFEFGRSNSEILFELFPSIFMPYLDIKTFCSLLKTDLWDWYHLLSDRILFDYCHYISHRNSEEIDKFCDSNSNHIKLSESIHNTFICDTDTDTNIDSDIYTDSDTGHDTDIDYDNTPDDINISAFDEEYTEYIEFDDSYSPTFCDVYLKDEEQNFCIVNLEMMNNKSNKQIIDESLIYFNFKNIDIIHDRSSLTELAEISLTTKLCKNIKIRQKNNVNNKNGYEISDQKNKICSANSFDELINKTLIKYYDNNDLNHIKRVLLTDILELCIKRWYFVEYQKRNIRNKAIIETKQMIIGHFDTNYNKELKSKTADTAHQLFVVWSIEWEDTLRNHH